MQLRLPDRMIDVFSVIYREESIQEYGSGFIFDFIAATKKHGYSGLLLFEANRSNLDPWVTGQQVIAEGLVPFIAINPVYMHPFAAARKIGALSRLFERRIFINFITGTSESDLTNLCDGLSHDQRYDRLGEYIYILDHLLRSRFPLTYRGQYYQVRNLLVSAKPDAAIFPSYFAAGSSSGTRALCEKFPIARASMGKNMSGFQKECLLPAAGSAMHFGIMAAATRQAALRRLDEWIGDDKEGAYDLFVQSMGNTQSKWKQELLSGKPEPDSVFSLEPLRHLRADCPYYIGSTEEIAENIVAMVMNGFTTLMVETPDFPGGFVQVEECFRLAESFLLERCYRIRPIHFDFKF
jgi:alkanesulfonate monooxygenase